jgi:hypothetical protein
MRKANSVPLSEAVRNDETAVLPAPQKRFFRASLGALAVVSDRLDHGLGIVLKEFASRGGEEL